MFKEDGPETIRLPDGTLVPNYARLTRADEIHSNARQAELQRGLLDAVTDVNRILRATPTARMSETYRIRFANSLDIYETVFASAGDPNESIEIPWPPSAERPAIRTISRREAQAGLRRALSREQLDRIQGVYRTVIARLPRPPQPLSELTQLTPQRERRIRELVELSRQSVIKALTRGRPEETWTPEERALAQKIRAVQIEPLGSSQVASHVICQGILPNAFYDPETHAVSICPSIYNLPDAYLIRTLAHEFAHPIDPCACQLGHGRVNVARSREVASEASNDPDLAAAIDQLSTGASGASRMTGMYLRLNGTDEGTIAALREMGVLEELSPTVPLERHPRADVMDCLASPAGGGFRRRTSEDMARFVENTVSARQRLRGRASYDADADRQELRAALERHPQCSIPPLTTEMGEAMSDWFGARALDEFIGRRELTPQERLGIATAFGAQICLGQGPNAGRSISSIVQAAVRDIGAARSTHPPDRQRVEAILLRNPNVARAMGCSATGPECGGTPKSGGTGGTSLKTRPIGTTDGGGAR